MTSLIQIEQDLNPFPIYAQMRRENPVFYDPQRGNWSVFRYADVQRVLSDYKVFSSQFIGNDPHGAEMPLAASMISTDPPRHRKLRGLVTQAFTQKAVDAIKPRIQQIVDEYLDKVMQAGQMDIIADLATPLPVIVIAEMLGVPASDRDRFKVWSDKVVSMADLGGEVNYDMMSDPAILEMSAYFFNMIEQRRQEPADDLISGLLAAKLDGESLNEIELLGFCALLLVAGNETTTNLIGNAMLSFAEHPEAWEQLRAEPGQLPQAIEEVLRFRSPVQSMFRVTASEAELAGVSIPPKAAMVAWIGSANRDEEQFPNPERFDITRTPNKHMAFGHGIHFCLGAPLARLESSIAIRGMLERFRTFEIAPDTQLERLPSLIVFGVKNLLIRFQT